MYLKKLSASNFVTYKKLDIDSFPCHGLIGITGWNFDNPIMGSNAVGKSLFMDMITYAWHGEVVRKKRANVVGSFAKSMSLEITMVDPVSNEEYTIKRTKGKTSGEKVYFTVGGETSVGTPTKIQPIIDRVFGMSWLTAKNCVIYSDEASHDHFMHVTDARQKEIFGEIADILHLRVARKLIMRDLKEEIKALRFTQGKLESAKDRKAEAKKRFEDSQRRLGNYKTDNKKEVERIKAKIIDKKKSLKKLSRIQDAVNRLSDDIADLKVSLNALEKKLEKVDIDALHGAHQKAVRVRARLHGVICEHTDSIEAAGTTGECPTCFGPMTKEAMARVDKVIKARNKELEKLQEKEKEAMQRLNSAQELEENYRVVEAAIEHRKMLKAQKERKLERYNTALAQIAGLEGDLKNIAYFGEEYQKEAEKAELDFDNAQRKFSSLFFEEKSRLQKIEAMEFWRKKYGPNELEADFIADLVTELEEEANRNIQDLTDGSVSIRISPSKVTPSGEKQEIVIEIVDEKKAKEFKLYSGGQRNRIEKAISIGLMSLQRGHIRLKLFDEIGKNLSQEGYERVVALMKGTFLEHQIFIATNNTEVQKFFDYRMKVTMRDGQSRVKTNWS